MLLLDPYTWWKTFRSQGEVAEPVNCEIAQDNAKQSSPLFFAPSAFEEKMVAKDRGRFLVLAVATVLEIVTRTHARVARGHSKNSTGRSEQTRLPHGLQVSCSKTHRVGNAHYRCDTGNDGGPDIGTKVGIGKRIAGSLHAVVDNAPSACKTLGRCCNASLPTPHFVMLCTFSGIQL